MANSLIILLVVTIAFIVGFALYVNSLDSQIDSLTEHQKQMQNSIYELQIDLNNLARKNGYEKRDDWIKKNK